MKKKSYNNNKNKVIQELNNIIKKKNKSPQKKNLKEFFEEISRLTIWLNKVISHSLNKKTKEQKKINRIYFFKSKKRLARKKKNKYLKKIKLKKLNFMRLKNSKILDYYIVHINLTFNNTRITVTKRNGNVLFWCTCGHRLFFGAKKSTHVASNTVINYIHRQILNKKLKRLKIVIKGGSSRHKYRVRVFIRKFLWSHRRKKFRILSIINLTPISYNGCKVKKKRR